MKPRFHIALPPVITRRRLLPVAAFTALFFTALVGLAATADAQVDGVNPGQSLSPGQVYSDAGEQQPGNYQLTPSQGPMSSSTPGALVTDNITQTESKGSASIVQTAQTAFGANHAFASVTQAAGSSNSISNVYGLSYSCYADTIGIKGITGVGVQQVSPKSVQFIITIQGSTSQTGDVEGNRFYSPSEFAELWLNTGEGRDGVAPEQVTGGSASYGDNKIFGDSFTPGQPDDWTGITQGVTLVSSSVPITNGGVSLDVCLAATVENFLASINGGTATANFSDTATLSGINVYDQNGHLIPNSSLTFTSTSGTVYPFMRTAPPPVPVTYYVATSGSDSNPGTQAQPFLTIQHGINTAQIGDTVQVDPGVYTGTGNVNLDLGGKAITVKGASDLIDAANPDFPALLSPPPSSTTIDCGNAFATRGVIFQSGEGADSVFEGFTIENGNEADGNVGTGGGIFVTSNSSPTIQNCVFIKNTAEYGGGVGLNTNSNPVIKDCLFANNSTPNTGGGMIVYGNCNPTLVNDSFSGNTAGGVGNGAGGGVEIYAGSAPIITGCTFTMNTAQGSGGGLHLGAGSTATVTNTLLYGDTAPDGEIGADSGNTVSVSYCDVQQATGVYSGTNSAHNINADPDYAGHNNGVIFPYDEEGDTFEDTPCLGAGTASAPGYDPTDINGNPRNPQPSIGAFERCPTSVELYAEPGALTPNSSVYGTPPTFYAAVVRDDLTLGQKTSGTLSVFDGNPNGGTLLGSLSQNNANLILTATPASLSVGVHSINATYTPDDGFFLPSSNTFTETVVSVTAASSVLTVGHIRVTASGSTVTVTGTILNTGTATAYGAQITRATLGPPTPFSPQQVHASGPLPGPFNIPAGQAQQFMLTFTTTQTGPLDLKIGGTATSGLTFSYGSRVSVP